MDYSKEDKVLKVELENFQSISNASLEFVKGINTIIGQSNSGKTAILRAIRGAILNPSGSQSFIKHGTKGFKVNLEYDGNSIEWARSSKSPSYKVNGEDYQKVGGSNLVDILDNSGFVLSDKKELMNLESELELLFPFGMNGSELFKLFEKNIFCVSDSTSILKLVKADEEDISRSIDQTKVELERYRNKLEAVKELEELIDLDKLAKGRNTIATLLKNIEKLTIDIKELSGIIVAGRTLSSEIPVIDVDTNLIHEYTSLLEDVKKLNNIRCVGNVLKAEPNASTPTVLNIDEYEGLKKAVKQVENAIEVESILSPLEASTTRVNIEEYSSILNDLKSLLGLQKQAQNLCKLMEEKKAEIVSLENKKKEFKVCPLCGSELNET